jgi:PhzF family phenazine biosynthesis protein
MIRLTQVDAFTNTPFRGNPAGVCLLHRTKTDGWLQDVAREMNLSETAFLWRRADGFDLRWFTPTVEIALCGHATLASAHVLWEEGHLSPDQPARFHTMSGLLTAERRGDRIVMDFPAEPDRPADPVPGLADALGATPLYVGRNRLDYLAVMDADRIVRTLAPDFAALRELGTRGVIVTARSVSPAFDFVSRFFAPGSGIDEDPVTGSAHCCLGPYWMHELGKHELVGYQASSRGGVVHVDVRGDRVLLAGEAVTVMRAELCCE